MGSWPKASTIASDLVGHGFKTSEAKDQNATGLATDCFVKRAIHEWESIGSLTDFVFDGRKTIC